MFAVLNVKLLCILKIFLETLTCERIWNLLKLLIIPAVEFASLGGALSSFFNLRDHWVWEASFPVCPTAVSSNHDPKESS